MTLRERPAALAPAQGELVIFATSERASAGRRGISRGTLRHGVNRVLAGARHTLGVIAHDACSPGEGARLARPHAPR